MQKNFSESIHHISRTRLMQMMQPLYPVINGTMYANVPTYNGVTVLWWYALVTYSLNTWSEP